MKQIKVLGVIAIALTLGLTACGKKAECKKHTWGDYVTVKEATCTTDGSQKRTCTVCGKEETKVIKAGHKYSDWSVETPSTCETAGSQKRTCSVCGNVDTQPLPLADHTYPQDEEGNDIVAWTTFADCTTAGAGTKTCSVCGHEEAVTKPALDHDFQKDAEGNIVFTWAEGKAPTCTKAGEGTKHCTRCNKDIAATSEEAAALGHNLEAIGGVNEPGEGEATVRVWKCKRCNEEYLGFKANEVTEESKSHLVFSPETVTGDEEQGARFWGRPIGNAIPLKADGSYVNNTNYACVYCTAETGDFFEYKFTLNAAQAEKLQNCRLYCDAKPAAYLNGQDFWACSPSADEYTSGFYIDGADDHVEKDENGAVVMTQDHEKSAKQEDGTYAEGVAKVDANGEPVMVKKGKRIDDYRYILYVDGQVKAFDPEIKAPVTGGNNNEKRTEYVMPYTFSLHEGQNVISLRMAAGYRSMFYNFIFRPYEAPEVPADPWVLDEETVMPTPAADAATVLRYKNTEDASLVKYEIAAKTGNFTLANDGSKWKTDPSTGEFKLDKTTANKEGSSFSFKFSLPKAFEGKMYQYGYMDSYSSNKTKKLYYNANNESNIQVRVNGSEDPIDMSQFATTVFTDVFGDELNGSNSVSKQVEIGNVNLKESNTISYKRVQSLNLIISKFVFIGKDHKHTFDYGTDPVPVQKAGECDYVVGQCAADGAKVLKISAAADLNGKITSRGGKLPKGASNKYDGTAIASYKFTAPEGFGSKAHLMAIATPDNAGNYDYSYYTGKDSSGSTKNPMPDGSTNTVVTINTDPITMPKATYRQMGCTGLDEAGAGLVDFGEFEVIEGTNEFTLAATNSYGLQYYDFLIVA